MPFPRDFHKSYLEFQEISREQVMTLTNLLSRIVKRINRYIKPDALDLRGDRDIEWAFIAGHIPESPGIALDFGCGETPAGLAAALKGYKVIALDLNQVHWSFMHPSMEFIKEDINTYETGLTFDLIINCSTIEHIGISGRYGGFDETNGDLTSMQRLRFMLKPGGIHLMTIPVGKDKVCPPFHRIYGNIRLPQLLEGYQKIHEEYWIKRSGKNLWIPATKNEALEIEGGSSFYGLGLFILRN